MVHLIQVAPLRFFLRSLRSVLLDDTAGDFEKRLIGAEACRGNRDGPDPIAVGGGGEAFYGTEGKTKIGGN